MSFGNYKNLEIKQARKSLRDDSSFPTNNVLIRTLDYTDSSENKKIPVCGWKFHSVVRNLSGLQWLSG